MEVNKFRYSANFTPPHYYTFFLPRFAPFRLEAVVYFVRHGENEVLPRMFAFYGQPGNQPKLLRLHLWDKIKSFRFLKNIIGVKAESVKKCKFNRCLNTWQTVVINQKRVR